MKPLLGYASETVPKSDAGMGRPKRKTAIASFRLDPRALAALHARAEAEAISPRSWLEKNLLALPDARIVVRKVEHPDLRALLFQVSRAGNNLNQLAHKFNSLDMAGQLRAGHLDDAIAALRRISAQLHKALSHAR